MARYADEHAVANSQRSFYQLHVGANGVPWGSEALDLLDEIAAERLPEHLTQRVRENKQRRRREAEEAERVRRKRQADVEALLEALPDLSVSERSAAVGPSSASTASTRRSGGRSRPTGRTRREPGATAGDKPSKPTGDA